MVLGDLTTQHHVLVSSFDPRKHEGACELLFTQRWLRLRGQNTVDEHQRVAVAVVALLVKAEKQTEKKTDTESIRTPDDNLWMAFITTAGFFIFIQRLKCSWTINREETEPDFPISVY